MVWFVNKEQTIRHPGTSVNSTFNSVWRQLLASVQSSVCYRNIHEMVDVIVVGAGISGLSSAMLLMNHGLKVTVLEARDRVGGRTFTQRDAAFGGYTDLGGAYVGPSQRRVARLAHQFGLQFYKISEEKPTLMAFGDKWMTYKGTIPPIYNPFVAMDVNNLQQVIDSLARTVPADAPWRAEKAEEWDTMTAKEMVDKLCWTEFARSSAAIICRAVLCAELHEVSALAFLWYVSSGQGLQRLINITDGAQERKFVGGAQQLSEHMAETLGDQVHLSSPVIRVQQLDDGVNVFTADGQMHQAKYLISAIPLALLNRITFIPSLPALKLQMIQRVPMGSIIKTMTFYDRAYWRESNLAGQMATDSGPVLYCIDDTKPDGSAPCLMGFVLADRARSLTNMTAEERKKVIAAHYAEKFRIPELLNPVNYVEKNWAEDEYSGGCYVSNFPPGVLTRFGEEMRRPFLKTFFAGTETATFWAGYMDGAIQAGERAAREVLHAAGKIPASEIWQDEPDFPEMMPEKPLRPLLVERLLPSVSQCLVGAGVLCVSYIVMWLYSVWH